jgi:hypothetical protein
MKDDNEMGKIWNEAVVAYLEEFTKSDLWKHEKN